MNAIVLLPTGISSATYRQLNNENPLGNRIASAVFRVPIGNRIMTNACAYSSCL